MIDRLSVLCFAGTYGLALAAELARFVVRSTVRWYVAAGLTALGWLVQTAFLANLAIKNPLVLVTTAFESVMVLSWIVALIGLYLMVRSPKPVASPSILLTSKPHVIDHSHFAQGGSVLSQGNPLQTTWFLSVHSQAAQFEWEFPGRRA